MAGDTHLFEPHSAGGEARAATPPQGPAPVADEAPRPLLAADTQPSPHTEAKPIAAPSAPAAIVERTPAPPPAAPAVVPESYKTWSVEAGSTLQATLLDWGRSAGREIVFELPRDMEIEVGGRFEGEFEEALAWLLRGFDRARPRPIARLRSNAVVIEGAKDDLGGGARS